MFICDNCGYQTDDKSNFRRHQRNLNHKNKIKCECGKEFTHSSSFSRHKKSRCDTQSNPDKIEINHSDLVKDLTHQLEIEKLKHQYELEKYKNQADKIISLKESEKKDIQLEHLTNQLENLKQYPCYSKQEIKNQINVSGGNNQFINKRDTLNMYFKDVIDINTFTENLKNGYGLTSEDTKSILDGYHMSGIKSYVPNVCYYLKKSYTKQYKAIFGRDPQPEEILLPFVISDSGLRQHYEKTLEEWQSTTSNENIKKIIVISNDQIYQHHNQTIPMTALDKVIILNSMLRINNYNSIITDIKEKDKDKKIKPMEITYEYYNDID
jgi:hypothetical protein